MARPANGRAGPARQPSDETADLGGRHRITLLPEEASFYAASDEDLLTAALRHGLPVMYGCRHGNCGTCLHHLVVGDIAEGVTSPYVLSPDSRERGSILLCSTFARSDIVVERPDIDGALDDGEVIPPEPRHAEVLAVVALSPSLVEVRVRLNDSLRFHAGQYVEVRLPEVPGPRSLSIASPPRSADHLTFVLSLRPGRRFSEAVRHLRAGDGLPIEGPFGHFQFRESGRPALMVAYGSGIAPILSIVRHVADGSATPPLTLYYGGPADQRAYLDELERLAVTIPGFTLRLVPAAASGGSDLAALTRLVASELGDGSGHDAYICGVPPMCDALTRLLAAKGMPERHIRVEKFYRATARP